MTHVPVFTQQHLRQAYELFMDPQAAERWSAEWWVYFAGTDVDEDGYLLAEIDLWRVEEHDQDDDNGGSFSAVGVILNCRPGSPGTGGFEILAGPSADEKGAHILNVGFTDFTLNLVSLVSHDVARRVRELRNYPQDEAEEGLLQARLIVEAIRPPQARESSAPVGRRPNMRMDVDKRSLRSTSANDLRVHGQRQARRSLRRLDASRTVSTTDTRSVRQSVRC